MLRDFNNESFERFLKQNADQVRMRPSGKVWKKISNNINKRKRWFGFGLLLLSSSLMSLYLTNSYSPLKPIASNYSNKPVAIEKTTSGSSASQNQSFSNNYLKVKKPSIKSKKHNIIVDNKSFSYNTNINAATTSSKQNISPAANLITGTVLPLFDAGTANTLSKELQTAEPLPDLDANKQNKNTIANKANGKRHKVSFEAFFTPTISYRKLTDNNQSTVQQGSFYNYLTYTKDINSLVTQKPSMGIELAFIAKYPISKSIKLRSGLQFNMSRYGIKALDYTPELTTIAVSNRSIVNSITALSKYRNINTDKADWLQNMFLQIAVPVGFEAKIGGTDKVQFGIAATIQPTYVMSNKAYLLSSNYQNYVEAPWLVRRWNANTSFETFMSYSTGHMQWQVGPQVRYQLLSSFKNKYPVKENLYDFGFKVGVSLNNQ